MMNIPIKLMDSVSLIEQTFDDVKVRGVIISGSTRTLIFDTLIFPEEAKNFIDPSSQQELVVVYSHADWDHIWGTCGLPRPYELIAHEYCAKRLADKNDVEKTLVEYGARFGAEFPSIEIIPPQRTFHKELSLDLGGLTVELRHCPGHTKDSILAIIPELSLLLGADCIELPIPLLNETSEDLFKWISILSELEADPRIETCIPSHGDIGGKEILTKNISYLKSLLSDETEPPKDLDAFYKEGHRENRLKCSSLRNPQSKTPND